MAALSLEIGGLGAATSFVAVYAIEIVLLAAALVTLMPLIGSRQTPSSAIGRLSPS